MIAVSHPTGNANVRALLRALETAGDDYELFTTIACSAGNALVRWLPGGIQSELCRRDFSVPAARIHTHPLRETVRLAAKRLHWDRLVKHEHGWASVDAVYRALDECVARWLRNDRQSRFSVVHAYEDGALESFRAARDRGVLCSYELPIAYWETSRKLLSEEAERWPDWEPTLIGTRDSEAKLERKTRELELADLVICPSGFVLSSLPATIRRRKRCVVTPFGSPQVGPLLTTREPNPKLRVLFVGSLTQRKGLADLFDAMRLLKRNDVELVVLGAPIQPLEFYRVRGQFTYKRPRSHPEVLALMQSCDVFVLPSIVEGRALVQQEALSCGLPLIVTKNAGGEDLIDEGLTGFLVPIRNPEAIADRIQWFAEHREALPEMAEHARRKAASITWAAYGEAVRHAFRSDDQSLRPEPQVPGAELMEANT